MKNKLRLKLLFNYVEKVSANSGIDDIKNNNNEVVLFATEIINVYLKQI